MNTLGQVFGMYRPLNLTSNQAEESMARRRRKIAQEEERKRQGKALGDLARMKLGVDTDFMKINEDLEMNKPMYDPSLFDYDLEGAEPNDFELAVMQDEANDKMSTMDYYSPQELKDMETANLYQSMGEAGFGQQALNQMFPNQKNDRYAQLQAINTQRAQINSQLAGLTSSYMEARRNRDIELANSIKAQADELNRQFMGLSPVGSMTDAPAYRQMMGTNRDFNKDQRNQGISNIQSGVNSAFNDFKAGLITEDEYRRELIKAYSDVQQFGGKIIDPSASFQKQDIALSGERRAQEKFADDQVEIPVTTWQKNEVNKDLVNRMMLIQSLNSFKDEALKGNPTASKNLLAGTSRLGSDEALSDSEFALLTSGNFSEAFQREWEAKFGAGSKVGISDVNNALNTLTGYRKTYAPKFNQAVKQGIAGIRKDAGKYADRYSDQELRAKLVSNLGGARGGKPRLDPSNFQDFASFQRAGGTWEQWAQNMN